MGNCAPRLNSVGIRAKQKDSALTDVVCVCVFVSAPVCARDGMLKRQVHGAPGFGENLRAVETLAPVLRMCV